MKWTSLHYFYVHIAFFPKYLGYFSCGHSLSIHKAGSLDETVIVSNKDTAALKTRIYNQLIAKQRRNDRLAYTFCSFKNRITVLESPNFMDSKESCRRLASYSHLQKFW